MKNCIIVLLTGKHAIRPLQSFQAQYRIYREHTFSNFCFFPFSLFFGTCRAMPELLTFHPIIENQPIRSIVKLLGLFLFLLLFNLQRIHCYSGRCIQNAFRSLSFHSLRLFLLLSRAIFIYFLT